MGNTAGKQGSDALGEPAGVRILVVEDDEQVAQHVVDHLVSRNLGVQRAGTLTAARRFVETARFDLVILDLSLPDGNGLDFAGELQVMHQDVPILMLTAKSGIHDRVVGFQRGADDYLCKPFHLEELAARIDAILRRATAARRRVLLYADLEFDLVTRTVRRGPIDTILSARESELLAYFLQHPDEPLTRDRILQEVWRDETETDSNILNVYINYLRNKIEHGRGTRLIHTVRGVGYMLSLKDPEESAAILGGI